MAQSNLQQQLADAQQQLSNAHSNLSCASAEWAEISSGQRACGERTEDRVWREYQEGQKSVQRCAALVQQLQNRINN